MLGDIYRETQGPGSAQQGGPGAAASSSPPAVRIKVSLVRGVIDAPSGSYYVPLSQPLANLAIAALEPDNQGSYFDSRLLNDLAGVARVMSVPSLKADELP
jgi:hypothetical protein